MQLETRRNFLKYSVAGAAASAAAPLANAWQQSPGKPADNIPIRVSIMCYSFYGLQREGKMDVFGCLESAKYRYGVQGVDLWNGFLTGNEESYLKKVREAYEERELVCPSLAIDMPPIPGKPGMTAIWADDPAIRDRNHDFAMTWLKATKTVGARHMRIDAGGARGDKEWSKESFDYIVKRYKEYCRFGADNGFKVGPEVHWGPETIFSNMQKLVQAVDHPAFGIILQVNAFAGTPEEKATYDRAAAKWACSTHISWDVAHGPLVERMNFLRDAGYQGYYTAEHHSGTNEYAEVAIQVSRIRAVIQSWRAGGNGELYPPRPPRAGDAAAPSRPPL
jgi:sugar phosphate isomerase/epimerase